MTRLKNNSIEVSAQYSSYSMASEFIEDQLHRLQLPKNIIFENLMAFEETFVMVVAALDDESELIKIFLSSGSEGSSIGMTFGGRRFEIDFEALDDNDPSSSIIKMYRDKYTFKYRRRENSVSILVKRKHTRIALCMLLAFIAIGLYSLLRLRFDSAVLKDFGEDFISPVNDIIMKLFGMVAEPLVFTAIVANIVNIYSFIDIKKNLGRTIRHAVNKSLAALLCAALCMLAASYLFIYPVGKASFNIVDVETSPSAFINKVLAIVPESLLDIFSGNIFTLMIVAILTAAAICMSGAYFNALQTFIAACSSLLHHMLSIIIQLLPFALFTCVFELLLRGGYEVFIDFARLLLLFCGFMLVFAALLACKLKVNGIPPLEFIRICIPAIKEGLKVGYVSDAVCYNTRFCHRHFGIDRSLSEPEFHILSFISLDGNCFFLASYTYLLIIYFGGSATFTQFLVISLIILLLSSGVVNHTGSIITNMVIITSALDMPEIYFCVFIIVEALFSGIMSAFNYMSNVISVSIKAKKQGCFHMPEKKQP